MNKNVNNSAHLLERVKEKPENYPICLHLGCEKRSQCLRALETTEEQMRHSIITCVNPLEYKNGGASCPQFRDKEAKCLYALGMRRIVATMKRHGLYKAFMNRCMSLFCHTIYYEVVAGHRVIKPDEQRAILGWTAELGVPLSADSFDLVVECTRW